MYIISSKMFLVLRYPHQLEVRLGYYLAQARMSTDFKPTANPVLRRAELPGIFCMQRIPIDY
jgi:hypothetical protein